ncbi:MAG TPA: toxin-antitoxin system HicB family antitoxin [Verrucomicrobia bacterium]|nr:MAG: CopG family transcriptional regulator [Lentisphaerae bacterium GWF2_57_35]HBA86188.1 toxin-antitoxin system HicB family antitoxin [Verrucomicrobiota bacterium]
MSALSLRLPNSLHNRVKVLSEKDHISINQFVTSAVAEKISALDTEEYIQQRAKRATRNKFLRALSRVPDREPVDEDKL